MAKREAANATWDTSGEAAHLFLRGATVATATRIAVVVGLWLSVMNQGDALVHGHAPWLKVALNFVTPFVVSSLGYLAARRRRNIERLVELLGDRTGGPGAR